MSDVAVIPQRVLVVDDNEDSAEMLAELLTLHGYTSAIATSGMAALARMHEQAADVVLLDLGLPDIDGFEVARQLRARFGKAPFIIMLSGYSGSSTGEAARAAGCDAYVVKPLDADDLTRLLDAAASTKAHA